MSKKRKPKPPAHPCEGCGVCCFEQVGPPGYTIGMIGGTVHEDDRERFETMPKAAREELEAHVNREIRPREDEYPCIWLDRDTLKCRWYEHRPQLCRDMEVLGAGCRNWRRLYGVRLPKPEPEEPTKKRHYHREGRPRVVPPQKKGRPNPT